MKYVMRPVVYFVEAVGLDMVKIGYTNRIDQRIVALRMLSPCRLKLRALVCGDPLMEKKIHRVFKTSCSHGEWFFLSPELEGFLKELDNNAGKCVSACGEVLNVVKVDSDVPIRKIVMPKTIQQRRRMRHRNRSKWHNRKPCVMGREEIVDFLVKNNVRTHEQLVGLNADGVPSLYACKMMFGSWNEAKNAAFGTKEGREWTKEEVLKTCRQNGVNSRRAYIDARKRFHNTLPSVRYVVTNFGGFTSLMAGLKMESKREVKTDSCS